MGALGITTHTLASAVADEATVAIAYPTGTTQASLTGSTAGTFDGTNDVATLNAPGEALTVLFDETGRGQIIENTGSVALS